jgi:hypothetical protein
MGFSEFAMGFDGFGSAVTDVSAFWLISSCSFWHHAAFSQNAETSVAAEPNASNLVANSLKSNDRIYFIFRQIANANFLLAASLTF